MLHSDEMIYKAATHMNDLRNGAVDYMLPRDGSTDNLVYDPAAEVEVIVHNMRSAELIRWIAIVRGKRLDYVVNKYSWIGDWADGIYWEECSVDEAAEGIMDGLQNDFSDDYDMSMELNYDQFLQMKRRLQVFTERGLCREIEDFIYTRGYV